MKSCLYLWCLMAGSHHGSVSGLQNQRRAHRCCCRKQQAVCQSLSGKCTYFYISSLFNIVISICNFSCQSNQPSQQNSCLGLLDKRLCLLLNSAIVYLQVLELMELTENPNYKTNKLRVQHRKQLLHTLSQRYAHTHTYCKKSN